MSKQYISAASGPGTGGQSLLKRHSDLSPEVFRSHHTQCHAPLAIPWALANGVTYYAQVRLSQYLPHLEVDQEQIHRPLRWANAEVERKYTALGIELEVWDAVGENVFPPGPPITSLQDFFRGKIGMPYYKEIILPDKRSFLIDEALKHLQGVEPGAVEGDRVEFIVDGKAVMDLGKWETVWRDYASHKTLEHSESEL